MGDYLTIDLLNVAMDSNKKYFFAPVLMSDGSILYCNIGDKTAIVPDLEPDEPAWTQYKALSSLYVRTFPNTWCDTGVLKTLSKGTILELDVSHKLRDPRFGNDWAYARYKQSDGHLPLRMGDCCEQLRRAGEADPRLVRLLCESGQHGVCLQDAECG